MLNHYAAKNEIRDTFKTRLEAVMAAGMPNEDPVIPPLVLTPRGSVQSYTPEIKWHNIEKTEFNDAGKHWMRLAIRNVVKNQKSFTGGRVDGVGTRFWTKGIVRVEIYYSPISFESKDQHLDLMVESCFQGNTACGVWFHNAVIVDVDPENNHFRSNVLAEFKYESVKT